ncbi:hypothetical protein GJ744_003933 [Endocarpon pusillum]|uniref:Deacetylase sirtuin-type domain-containing protein n=1 Tax=Endocarpon pusillum TaxID=364733 RepID=A0A8H7A8J6_9EURO|nr:hypothetical protein GJ744_003933 [Endocarpon pusillum]
MNALSTQPSIKKRKSEQEVPASAVKSGLCQVESSDIFSTHDRSTLMQSRGSTCSDEYHIICRQCPVGLEADISPESPGQSRAKTDIAIAKAEVPNSSDCMAPGSKDAQTAFENGSSPVRAQTGNDLCTYEEALAIRYHVREIGLEHFFQNSVLEQRIPLQTLSTVFGVTLPTSPSDIADNSLYKRLRKAITVDISNRIKLHKYNSVKDAIALVQHSKNIMVITGAGISTSLDIPDFRSPGGLYSTLRDMGFEDPESVFSRDTFEQDPRPFFSVAAKILPPTDGRYTPAHAFLRLLQDKGKLLTLYTQNIDGIDLIAGIRRDKLVQLHGSFETATCITCEHRVRGEEIFPQIRKCEVPICTECAKERQLRVDQMIAMRAQNGRSVRRKTQRSSGESTSEPGGIMRPDIVFMGEPPRPYLKRFERDCAQVDLLIVMGTSLPVEPVNTMPNKIPPAVPQIYIGKNEMYLERSKRIDFDIQLLGECDVIAELLARGCGWDLKHEMLSKDTVIKAEPWDSGRRHCHEIRQQKIAAKDVDAKTEPKE